MTIVKINLREEVQNSYKIFIEPGISSKLPEQLKKLKIGQKYAIITDSKVRKLYGNSLLRLIQKNGIEADIFSFPEGEKSKKIATIEGLADEMINSGFDRKDAIIALGGGVVGDIAGFLSAIYMRGIPYIQIPTTLLAMVDSSVGGKTGVDLEGGKNLIGTFTQPKAVFIDQNHLKTLALKQIKSGMAEVIKYGVIADKKLFSFIEENIEKILALDEKSINTIISNSVKIKAKVVEEDEKESGKRMILNYGHTYGHAIEKNSGYKLLHGFAISIGMVIANKIAVKKGLLKETDATRIKTLLKNTGLPIVTVKQPTIQDLMSDKKRQGQFIHLILPTAIGKVVIYKEKIA